MDDKKEFSASATDQYRRWTKELTDAKEWFRHFHKKGEKVVKAFLDDRKDTNESVGVYVTRLNLFHANIVTLMSMLYGQIPKVEATRRFADADDDVSRVAGEILTRILNNDIEVAGEDLASVFRSGLQDRLLPGLGTARVQYQYDSEVEEIPAITDPETGEELAPATQNEKISNEWVDVVYTHWKDQMWSPCRTHAEVRWKAYRSYMGKEPFKKRFPKAKLDRVTFNTKGPLPKPDQKGATYEQAEIWEVWSKEDKKVYWYTEGYQDLLDQQDDPLELEGFWPDPPPLTANVTTSKFLPKSDYEIAQDLYREIDDLETRITLLTQSCKSVGVYDESCKGVQRIFNEGVENQLIPVENWAAFSEKGGLDGAIDWVPIKEIAETINILSQKQSEKIQQLYQVTGMNDVMRGAAQQEGTPVSATERKIQANYGSIRIEALQNEFARWVSDLQQLKAEIIAKHYQPYCIIEQSNIMDTPDAEYAEAAVQLIKNPDKARWKITVRPESLAIADYAQLKQDRTEYLFGLAQFLQSAAPMIQEAPASAPYLMKLLKWGMAGFRGSSEIEGVFDQAISSMEKQPPGQKPDPEAQKAQAEMKKMEMEMQMKQQDNQAKMQMEQEKHQAEMQLEDMKLKMEEKKMQMELYYMEQKFQLEMQELQMKLGFKQQEAQINAEATRQEQAAQFAFNTAEKDKDMEVTEHAAKVQMESGDEDLRRDKERAKLKPKSDGDAGST
jgi:hypothetical protein